MTRARAHTRLWHLVCAVAVVAVLAIALPVLADASPETPASVAASSSLTRSEEFQPIRIGVFAETLENGSKTCLKPKDDEEEEEEEEKEEVALLDEALTCEEDDVLTKHRSEKLVSTLMPSVVTRLQELLNVRRQAEPIKVQFAMEADEQCKLVDIPETHLNKGVSEYDVVIYLYAFTDGDDEGVVKGASCMASEDGRPLVIVLGTKTTVLDGTSTYHTWAAEVVRLLGFNEKMFTTKKMLEPRKVRGQEETTVVLARTALKREIEKQFGCAEQEYLDLHTKGSNAWSKRVMNFDIASPADMTYFSGITIAALEDTGLYTGNYDKADVNPWGFAGGCEFLKNPCLTESVALPGSPFCADKDGSYHCNAQRNALAVCDQTDSEPDDADWASEYGLWSTDASLEYCPVYSTGSVNHCTAVDDPRSGEHGVCLDASEVKQEPGTSFGVCATVRCDNEKGTYEVRVEGDGEWKTCKVGGTIDVTTAEKPRTVQCPPMYEVCVVTQEQLPKEDKPPSSPEEPPSGPGDQPPSGPGDQPPSGPGDQPPSGPGDQPETTTTRRPNGATRNSHAGSVVVAATLGAALLAISTL